MAEITLRRTAVFCAPIGLGAPTAAKSRVPNPGVAR